MSKIIDEIEVNGEVYDLSIDTSNLEENANKVTEIIDNLSNEKYPTANAVKTYVDSNIASNKVGVKTNANNGEIFNSYTGDNKNTASGDNSHAEGSLTTASGDCSHVEGLGTTASGEYQHVQGKYNITDTNNKYADIIGNGNESTLSNASTVDWNGTGWFKNKVMVGGTSQDDTNAKELATKEYVTKITNTKANKSDISNVYKYCGNVDTYNNLPFIYNLELNGTPTKNNADCGSYNSETNKFTFNNITISNTILIKIPCTTINFKSGYYIAPKVTMTPSIETEEKKLVGYILNISPLDGQATLLQNDTDINYVEIGFSPTLEEETTLNGDYEISITIEKVIPYSLNNGQSYDFSNPLENGNVYNVESTGKNYAWTGIDWDDLGGTFEISDNSVTTDKLSTDLQNVINDKMNICENNFSTPFFAENVNQNKSILNISTIVGDSLQNGTPTPNSFVEIQNVGDTCVFVSCGKNLVNANGNFITYSTSEGNRNALKFTNLVGKYRISAKFISNNSRYIYAVIKHIDNTLSSPMYVLTESYTSRFVVDLVKTDVLYIYDALDESLTVTKQVFLENEIQLEKNSNSIGFESYTGNTYTISTEDINGKTHELTKYDKITKHSDGKWYFDCNGGIMVFKGTESIIKNATSTTDFTYDYNLSHSIESEGLCSYFVFKKWASAIGTYSLLDSSSLVFMNFKDIVSENSVASVKAKLADWYAAGTPLKILYKTTTITSYELKAETQTLLNNITIQSPITNIYSVNTIGSTIMGEYPLDVVKYVNDKKVSVVNLPKEFKQTKNLLALPDMETKRYSNTDITIKDGVITLNTIGKETNSTCIRINFSHPGGYDFSGDASNTAWKTENVPFMAIGKSYAFSIIEVGGTKVSPSGDGKFTFGVRGTSDNVIISASSENKSLTSTPAYIYMFIAQYSSFSNYKFKLQIEEGKVPTEYINPEASIINQLKFNDQCLSAKIDELNAKIEEIENGSY